MSQSVSARVPEDTVDRVERLVEDGEFETRSEAVAELLTQRVDELGVELPAEDEEEDEVEIEEEDDEAAIPETASTEPVTAALREDNPPRETFLSGARSALGEIASKTLPEVPLAAAAGAWVVYGGGAQVLGIPTLLGPVFAVSLVLGAFIA